MELFMVHYKLQFREQNNFQSSWTFFFLKIHLQRMISPQIKPFFFFLFFSNLALSVDMKWNLHKVLKILCIFFCDIRKLRDLGEKFLSRGSYETLPQKLKNIYQKQLNPRLLHLITQFHFLEDEWLELHKYQHVLGHKVDFLNSLQLKK